LKLHKTLYERNWYGLSFKNSLSRLLVEEAGKEYIYYLDTILDDIEFVEKN